MTKSKDVIRRLKDDIETGYLSTKHDNQKDKENYLFMLEIVEKNLNKLEKLEKENKKLKKIIKENFDCFDDSKRVFFTYTEPVMEKEISEVLKGDK